MLLSDGERSSPSDMTAIVACDARFALASVQAPQWDSAGCNSRTTQMNWRPLTFPPAVYCSSRTHADQTPATGTPEAGSNRKTAEISTAPRLPGLQLCHRVHTGSKRFPISNFKHSFTLFSKFFSSFPHGTCSLSVSCQYLALDGIYHPL